MSSITRTLIRIASDDYPTSEVVHIRFCNNMLAGLSAELHDQITLHGYLEACKWDEEREAAEQAEIERHMHACANDDHEWIDTRPLMEDMQAYCYWCGTHET